MAPTAEPARTPPQSDAGKAAKAAQDRGKLEEMVKQMQQEFGFKQTKIAFEVDSDSKEMLVKVLDRQSGEVLRQFPPEELLKIREAFQDLSRGLLLNTNA